MRTSHTLLATWAGTILVLFLLSIAPAHAQISLGTAGNFGVLAGSTVTNTGGTTVNGNVGVSPGTAVIGFPPGIIVGGAIHSNNAVALQAQNDLTVAYNNIAGTPCTVDLTGQNLGGLTLTPGVYCFSTSAQLTGTLTLDALGNPNALFIIKTGSSLTTASGSSVVVINGGSSCNVFWQIGSSATLGTGSSIAGNILALSSITLTTGSSLSGRALARNGAVTLDTNVVNVCGIGGGTCPIITVNPATLPNGSLGTAYNQSVSASGGTAPYTFSVTSGLLPSGLIINPTTGAITGTPTTAGTFTFTITATDTNGCFGTRQYTIIIAGAGGCPAIAISPVTLPPGNLGAPYSQTIIATGGTAPYAYTITSGALPGGLSLNPATGLISGTPTTLGQYNFTVTATDANGCPGARPYTMVILAAACPAITVNPTTLPTPVPGFPYSQTVTASGGTAPYTFAVTSGALPAGLSLNPASGQISGTPTAAGNFNFTITATDANGCMGSRDYALVLELAAFIQVPSLSGYGMLLLILLLGGMALVALGRNRA